MAPGSYTELFFLDEATALAAGHRPCWECRRDAYYRYVKGIAVRSAEDANNLLHPERILDFALRPEAHSDHLPDGTIVSPDGKENFYLKWRGRLLTWSFSSYAPAPARTTEPLRLITPPTTVRALAAGYPVEVHPSANAISS